ncbi:hypothetical protein NDU88_004753 [Pleurodeles waltl]|uniref:Uncharacterized protein n=1 Tax=Pleurodeles waltl TaxID=8319 RepID=A0AAV7LJ37_PLEWA|nr:hypothetical protein NDU88_004753 [Pleurodeles waltl]
MLRIVHSEAQHPTLASDLAVGHNMGRGQEKGSQRASRSGKRTAALTAARAGAAVGAHGMTQRIHLTKIRSCLLINLYSHANIQRI